MFTPAKILGQNNNEALTKPASLAVSVYQVLDKSVTTGAVESSGPSTTASQKMWVSYVATTGSDGVTSVLTKEVLSSDTYVVDTVNAANAAHNGQRMLIATGGLTLNNTGTDNTAGPFEQIETAPALGANKIIARKV